MQKLKQRQFTKEDYTAATPCSNSMPGTNKARLILPRDRDPRIRVNNINDFKYNPNHYFGNQGHVCMAWHTTELKRMMRNEIASEGPFVGSGALVFLPTTVPWEKRKQFVLSCAHNFSKDYNRSEYLYAHFSYEQNGEIGDSDLSRQHNVRYIWSHPRYAKKSEITSISSDLAIGALKDIVYSEVSMKMTISDVREAKKGDTVCVIGYPGEYHGELFYQEGLIINLIYEGEDFAIIESSLYTTPGNSGSPVFLKKKGSWILIGVHVRGNGVKAVAVGLTKSKINWLNTSALDIINSKNKRQAAFHKALDDASQTSDEN